VKRASRVRLENDADSYGLAACLLRLLLPLPYICARGRARLVVLIVVLLLMRIACLNRARLAGLVLAVVTRRAAKHPLALPPSPCKKGF